MALPAALLPFSILLDKCVRLDRFADYLREGQPGTPNYFRHLHSALRRTENWERSRVSEAVLLGLARQSDPAHDPRRIRSHTVLHEGAFHGRTAAVRKIREMGLKGF